MTSMYTIVVLPPLFIILAVLSHLANKLMMMMMMMIDVNLLAFCHF